MPATGAGRGRRFLEVPHLSGTLRRAEGHRRGEPDHREDRVDRQDPRGTGHLGRRAGEPGGDTRRPATGPARRGQFRGRSSHRQRTRPVHGGCAGQGLRHRRGNQAAPRHRRHVRGPSRERRRRGDDVRAGESPAADECHAVRRRQRRARRRGRPGGPQQGRLRHDDARQGPEGALYGESRRSPADEARGPGQGRVGRMGDPLGRPRQGRRRVHRRRRSRRRGHQPELHAPVSLLPARRGSVHGERGRDAGDARVHAEAPEHRGDSGIRRERQPDRDAISTRRSRGAEPDQPDRFRGPERRRGAPSRHVSGRGRIRRAWRPRRRRVHDDGGGRASRGSGWARWRVRAGRRRQGRRAVSRAEYDDRGG